MRKFRVTKTIDAIFLYIVLFCITFVWVRYFVKQLAWVIITSAIISFFVYKIITYYTNKKYDKKEISNKIKKQIDECATFMLFSQKQDVYQMFNKILSKDNNTIIKDELIFFTDKTQTDVNQVTALIPMFESEIIDIQKLSYAYKLAQKHKVNKLIILCVDIEKTLGMFINGIKNMDIKIFDKTETFFNLYQKYDIYPKPSIEIDNSKKYTFKLLLSVAFNKKKTKGYLFCAAIFLICSYFIRYNLYYLVMSTILFVFAIISYFNKSFNQPHNKEINKKTTQS